MTIKDLLVKTKDELKGKWLTAIGSSIVMGIIGFLISFVVLFVIFFAFGGAAYAFYDNDAVLVLLLLLFFIVYIILVMAVGLFSIGYNYAMLDMVRSKQLKVMDFINVFKQQPLKVIGLLIVEGIFIFLWSLLFIIPGIIKIYSYSQSLYILKDNPEFGILECITKSRKMMNGNKMKLFLASLVVLIPIIIAEMIMTSGIDFSSYSDSYFYGYSSYYDNSYQVGPLFYLGTVLVTIISFLLYPYLTTLYAVFYEDLLGNKQTDNSEINNNQNSNDERVDIIKNNEDNDTNHDHYAGIDKEML